MAEPTVQACPFLSFLPTEVVTGVFAHLHKEDLKALRLVCRYFDEAVIPLLYDRVIISNQQANFPPFENIISRPRLSKHVKMLVYDIGWFDDYSPANYLMHLSKQLNTDLRSRLAGVDLCTLPTPLAETVERVGYFRATNTRTRQSQLGPWWEDVEKGYRAYHAQINVENSITNRQRITNAFGTCPNVHGIAVHGSWKSYPHPIGDTIVSLLPKYHSSGFLARHWSPFWLRPRTFSYATAYQAPLIEDVFDILHDCGKYITHLSVGPGCNIEPDIHVVPTSMHVDLPWVFSHLTNLSLDVSPTHPHSTYITKSFVPALRAALGLKYLTLQVRNYSPWTYMDNIRWRLGHPFDDDLIFPRLVYLHLSGFKGTATGYIDFFANQPRLQHLCLDKIGLIQETDPVHADWIGFTEGLRRLSGLVDFSIGWPLETVNDISDYSGGLHVMDPEKWPMFAALLKQYVLHGGENSFVKLAWDRSGTISQHVT
ncbi:MAG: hypothetical protein Q9208_005975 [Pyrenodesmia sp. 3 TL-2023]